MPDIQGRCPACSTQPLSLGRDGLVVCAALGCPDPGAANYLLRGGEAAMAALLGGGRLGRILAETLAASGVTYAKLPRATDAELLAIPGIGETSLARIREVFPTDGRHRERADQLEELLRVAHETSNRSEEERARAVRRAEKAEATLKQARLAQRRVNSSLIAVESLLSKPYPDDPRWTPWTRFVQPALKKLHDALLSPSDPSQNEEATDA